jgi:hypothetical protein
MAVSRQMIAALAFVLAGPGGGVSNAFPQEAAQPRSVQIPAGAVTLEGIPTVRIDSAEQGATRRVLGETEARRDRLTVSQVNGKYYWTSRENKLLQLNSSGPYTYLSSEPGRYIRFTRINDRISYVEHVDSALGSVTWWGELRIVGRKP